MRKYQLSKGVGPKRGSNLVVADNFNNLLIAVSSNNELSVIDTKILVDFEWTRATVNECLTNFDKFLLKLETFDIHYLSISANGYGSKLIVCAVENGNTSPSLLTYDLSHLAILKEKVKF